MGDYEDSDHLPKTVRNLRSCIGCGLLQTEEWWKDNSCPNCHLGRSPNKYTSASFSGMLAVFDPENSWCAKWQRYNHNAKGIYALYNEGEVTPEIIEKLESARMRRPLPEWIERAKQRLQEGGA